MLQADKYYQIKNKLYFFSYFIPILFCQNTDQIYLLLEKKTYPWTIIGGSYMMQFWKHTIDINIYLI